VNDYFSPYLQKIKNGEEVVRALNWKEALNGVPGSVYMHGMDWSTSMGDMPGKKLDYVIFDEDGFAVLDKEVM
jgi:hypothetical protein